MIRSNEFAKSKTRKTGPSPSASRETRPRSPEALRQWVEAYTGISIAKNHVCPGHHTPFEYFSRLYTERPSLALILGPRGGGKSFLSALDTHLTSRWSPRHSTRILGGSLSQSQQVYRAIRDVIYDGQGPMGSDKDSIAKVRNGEAIYRNGSDVSILAASSTSVRGPHVPTLKLDEVDEIDPDLREAAMGMCMDRHGSGASVVMTSTWHRLNGPMAALMENARSGAFPLYTFCAFEVLQRCSAERSGPWVGGAAIYASCPQCPLKPWCHAGADLDGGEPLAKRSSGHYGIDALIQKVRSTSKRTFESDYLCKGPRADGLWFPAFDATTHVNSRAEYDPGLPVHIAIDSGVFTGAVFFQVRRGLNSLGSTEVVHIFADYLAENRPAEQNARAILEIARAQCQGRRDVISTDPAGGSRNPVGPTVIGEYERVGLRPLRRWPVGSVADGLSLVESFVDPSDGQPRLLIHPRCTATIRAMENYRRAKRAGQWQDYPEDPQHPHEDLVDAIRGGLRVCFPEGRSSQPHLARVPARQVF